MRLIKSMSRNKSPGYDAKTIILCAKEISKPLTHIYNLSFQTGIVPGKLKNALVTPIFYVSSLKYLSMYPLDY
jgi:hypothetical protein